MELLALLSTSRNDAYLFKRTNGEKVAFVAE